MITYVNSGNDAKRFNTFALAAKHSLIKKQQSINTQIDYLKNVYNSYVSHYNQLQKLIKEINDLTGESRYTNVDYSDFPAVDVSASFSMKLNNVRLVPEGTSSLRFKNTIEDLRHNFSDLSLSIRSLYSKVMTELSPYSSMKKMTDNIREESSRVTNTVSTNISTALSEGDLSEEDWSNIKDLANASRDDIDEAMSSGESEAERKAREEAEAAAREAFNKEQEALDKAAQDALDKATETSEIVDKFGGGFFSSDYVDVDYDTYKVTYTDPITGEIFQQAPDGNNFNDSYTDSYGSTTSFAYDSTTGTYTVTKDGEVIGTYDNRDAAQTAANDAAGKDVFADSSEGGIISKAQDAYEESKQKAIENNAEAATEAQEAAEAADAHRESGSSDDSSGGT